MPPKFKFTREEIIQAALDLTRESGIAAVPRGDWGQNWDPP